MDNEPNLNKKQLPKDKELYTNNLEAHIIADMLRIESITTELREFKNDTRMRLNKLEGWIISIVAISFSTLLAVAGSLIWRLLG